MGVRQGLGTEKVFHAGERARAEAQMCKTVPCVGGAQIHELVWARAKRAEKLSRTRF